MGTFIKNDSKAPNVKTIAYLRIKTLIAQTHRTQQKCDTPYKEEGCLDECQGHMTTLEKAGLGLGI